MLGKLRQRYARFPVHQSMRSMIYFILVFLTVAVAVFVSVFVFRDQRNRHKEALIEDNRQIAEQINITLTHYIHNMIRLSDALYYDVIKNGEDRMEPMFQTVYDSYRDYVESIALFQEDGTLVTVVPAIAVSAAADVTEETWFTEAFGQSENIHFSGLGVQDYFEKSADFPWVISISRHVQIPEGDAVTEGVLLINVKYSALSELFQDESGSMSRYSFLTDQTGNLIYHPKQDLIDSGLMEAPPASLASCPDGSYEETVSADASFCRVETVGYTGWKIVSVISRKELSGYATGSMFFVLAILCLVLLVMLIVGYFISARLTGPIDDLERDVKRITSGELDLCVHVGGTAEIYRLGSSIQEMASRIRELMQEVISEQEAKRKSEIDSLQAQIAPHFLYNTLESVVWLIEEERNEDAAEMVTALGAMLRISLSKGKNIITVSSELEHVRNYLMIQSLREKDAFTYQIIKEPEVGSLGVIKLIVQPIVENAVYHGLSEMYGDGKIIIHAYVENQDLYISVRDNGVGMTEEQTEMLLDYTKEIRTEKGNGIGVRNVHERIQLYYGKAYGVQIHSELDEGTEVLLHLPAVLYGEQKE